MALMPVPLVGTVALVQTALLFVPVAAGTTSGITQPRQVVVRTTEDWRALWREHGAGTPVPSVDFSSATVVGLFLGERPTAGYQVDVVSVLNEGGAAVVEYVERRPSPDAMVAQVVTAPFHLVSLQRVDIEVRFRKLDGRVTGAGSATPP